jgi:hypothetical protein
MKYIEKSYTYRRKRGQYTFGYMLKGSFDSFFKGKKVPEKPKKEEPQKHQKKLNPKKQRNITLSINPPQMRKLL